MSTDENLEKLQREVQRKLGRNLIRLQQYERLIKAMVAEQDVACYMGELQAVKVLRAEEVSGDTLGEVVGKLKRGLLAQSGVEPSRKPKNEPPADLDRPWLRMSFQIEMSSEEFQKVQERLSQLVDLRNELVHHFLEKYDLWEGGGCLEAERYLDAGIEQINAHYEELRGWAKVNLDARHHMGRLVESAEFGECLVHGILPGGAGVMWEVCTIVRLLQEAEARLAVADWTDLNKAAEYLRAREPEHTPARYGCRTWRQVLHESRQFEVRKERSQAGEPAVTLYRSRGR